MMKLISKNSLWLAILVSALGYFVDVYDIILFTAVRIPSLKALSIKGETFATNLDFLDGLSPVSESYKN